MLLFPSSIIGICTKRINLVTLVIIKLFAMTKFKILKRLALFVLMCLSFNVDGQNLHVYNNDGTTSAYSIEDIRRITIEDPNFVVLLFNGDSFSFPLEDLTNYQYDAGYLGVGNAVSLINNWNLNIYPNPVEDQFTLRFSLEKPSKISYEILDVKGKIILDDNLKIQDSGIHEHQVSTEHLSKGIYFIKVNKNGISYSKKIVKQ